METAPKRQMQLRINPSDGRGYGWRTERLAGAGLAVYPSVERAVRAMAAHTKYWQRQSEGQA